MANEPEFADHLLTTVGRYTNDDCASGSDLYFIRSADGFCKIGRTAQFNKRITTLQSGCPHHLKLEMILPGMGWQEPVWHFAFSHIRKRNEWFHWGEELAAAVEAARVGDEWIATLTAPELGMRYETVGAAMVPFLLDQSPQSVADYLWRDLIADKEDEALERRLLSLPTPGQVTAA